MSKVMANGNERIKFPINEPAKGRRSRRSTSTWSSTTGPGVQHMALATDDIIATVTALRDRGVEFLNVPTTLLRRAAGARRQDRRAGRRARRSSASSSTAIRTATCCRSSPSRSRTGRRCSTRSSSARARGASARGTSRRCSRRSSGSRRRAGIFEVRMASSARCADAMPTLRSAPDDPSTAIQSDADLPHSAIPEAAHRVPNPAGLYAEELMGHEGFTGTSSLLYHTHPPTTVKSRAAAEGDEVRGRPGPDAAAPALPHLAGEDGREPDARPHSAAVQPGHRDAVRRARRERRALLPQRAGATSWSTWRRGRGRWSRCSATCRSARATTSSSTAASCTAGGSTSRASRPSCWSWRAGATSAGPSATATSSAS